MRAYDNKKQLLTLCCLLILSLSACNGVRNSYEPLLSPHSDKPVMVLKVGERLEVLAVGNGFPGWWGYYPGIISSNPSIASIDCEPGRSLIPFREPGIVFGGERCYLETKRAGIAQLITGNKYSLEYQREEMDLDASNIVIKVNVLLDSGD